MEQKGWKVEVNGVDDSGEQGRGVDVKSVKG